MTAFAAGDEPSGPHDRPRRVPGRAVWALEAVPDGSAVYVSVSTGELFVYPPSRARARRLAARALAHEELEAARRRERAEAALRGVELARAALPRRVPPGLQRPAGYRPERPGGRVPAAARRV